MSSLSISQHGTVAAAFKGRIRLPSVPKDKEQRFRRMDESSGLTLESGLISTQRQEHVECGWHASVL
jgi:hypothetical protein